MSPAVATILGAAVAALASIAVCVLNNNRQNAVMFYRLEELEKKVEKHNDLVERMALAEEKLKAAGRRLEGLEKQTGGK